MVGSVVGCGLWVGVVVGQWWLWIGVVGSVVGCGLWVGVVVGQWWLWIGVVVGCGLWIGVVVGCGLWVVDWRGWVVVVVVDRRAGMKRVVGRGSAAEGGRWSWIGG